MDTVKNLIQYAAKAVAALVVPFVLMAVNAFADWAGVDVPVDSAKLESWIVAIILAVVSSITVYFKANGTTEPAPDASG